MAERCRAFDWAATPLGAVEQWPVALRTLVRTGLESPFPAALWCGPEFVLIYNDGYRRVLGAKHPSALGQTGREVWPEIWAQIGPLLEGVRAGGPPFHTEDAPFATARTDGGTREDAWFTFSFSAARDDAGEVVAVLNLVTETTARVRVERRQQALAEALEVERARLEYVFRQAPTFLAVLRGPRHVVELANDASIQLVGHRAILGRPLLDVLPELRGQGFDALLDRVLTTGEPFVGREVPVVIVHTPGAPPEERFLDFMYLPLVEADGTRSGVIAHGSDVTSQVRGRREVERLLTESERARRDAEQARADADAANRIKSEFLATMSHEFRTPLNAILGYAQLLDMGVLGTMTSAQHAHLERLQASARHLLQIVDDVLDVAKVDADRLLVRRDVLVTGAAAAGALTLIQPQATVKGVRLLDLGADAPGVRYVGDEHRVRQILLNLLSNAVKFTPPGGEVTLTCGAVAEPAPGAQPGGPGREGPGREGPGREGAATPRPGATPAWAFIRITDTGPGLTPNLLTRLFEPFVQGDSALTREKGGTGLGLAISRRLARLMGGDLTVRNAPGGGAAFTLWLPAASPEPERAGGVGAEALLSASSPRRTPTGTRVIAPWGSGATGAAVERDGTSGDGEGALDDAAYVVLHALGVRLAADAETVSERYVAALRAEAGRGDGQFPGAGALPAVQLRDHATPGVGLLATQLMIIGETRGQAPELLGDGGQVQRLIDELHGAQRYRLGWTEADVEREGPLLLAEVERALSGAIDVAVTAGAAGTPAAGALDTDAPAIAERAVRAAARYAADVARHVVGQGTRTAIRGYHSTKAADAP